MEHVTHYREALNNYLQEVREVYGDHRRGRLTWETSHEGPDHLPTWQAIAYLNEVELGRGKGSSRGAAMEAAAERVLIALGADKPHPASTREEGQQDEEPPSSGGHDNNPPDSNSQERSGRSSPLESGDHSEDGNDFLEVEVPSGTPPPEFDFDEPQSPASSAYHLKHEVSSFGPSHAIPRSDGLPVASTREACAEPDLDNIESSQGRSIIKKWLTRKSNKYRTSHKPDRLSEKLCQPADPRSPSGSSTRVNATDEGPSWMAAGQRKRRTVAKWGGNQKDKSKAKVTVPNHPNNDASCSGQGPADSKEAGSAQQENNTSEPSATRVHVMHQQGSGDATISFRLPAWMLRIRPGTHDGTH